MLLRKGGEALAYRFYIDETGNRNPDKKADPGRQGRDWFGIGGILVKSEDVSDVKQFHSDFIKRWGIRSPLHMTDMLGMHKGFSWLGRLSDEKHDQFWSDYKNFLGRVPVVGLSCIIDRPGYVARGYLTNENRWLLCRSAFDIAIERAAKFARRDGRKLHVIFEQDAGINQLIKSYFENLRNNGLGFDQVRSGPYAPMSQKDFGSILGAIEHKPKLHPILQIADSYLYAMARHPYEKNFHVYRRLRDSRKIANFILSNEEIRTMGVKHYCFELHNTKR